MHAPSPSLVKHALCHVYVASRTRQIRKLASRFPRACPGQVEDAVDQALVELLGSADREDGAVQRAWAADGSRALQGLLSTAAWRALRGEHRRASSRYETAVEALPEILDARDPQTQMEAVEMCTRLDQLIAEAGQIHSVRSSDQLSCALTDRLFSGDADVAVALRHQVDRSLLCRARGWVAEQVMTG